MKTKGLRRLGCEVTPFSLAAFEEFVDAEAAQALHAKALAEIRSRSACVKPEELRMLVGARPDLFFAITFLIVGPFPFDESRIRDFGCISLQHPNHTLPTRQHGSADAWRHVPTDLPASYWKFLET